MAAQVAIRIGRILLAAIPFAEKAAPAKEKKPEDPSSKVTQKHRWLQCTIRNATDFPILSQCTFWSSGRYESNPGRVDAFEIGTFSACNGDGTVMTGVSGGQNYKIVVDETHSFEFSINPQFGSYKARVAKSGNAEDGYNAAGAEGGSIESDLYEAKDKDDNQVRFKIHVSATASQKPAFVVSEIRYN